jgi:hypothetical protein
MNGILSGLINLGLGGLMGAALVWFLHHLVTRTLPEMNRVFREEVSMERDLRYREHQALLQMMERLANQQNEEHEALLTHVSAGLKELTRLITEGLAALERRLDAWQVQALGQRQSPRPRPQ